VPLRRVNKWQLSENKEVEINFNGLLRRPFFLIMKQTVFLMFWSCLNVLGQVNPDSLIDNWHRAAATANYDAYFNATSDQFVFLGTAPGERWDKQAFTSFSKPYFDRGKAWDFKPSNRVWTFHDSGKIAWFDEDLDTWMQGCRGSGIIVMIEDEWKIAYYNLTVLIENEKMASFIRLRNKKIKKIG
jgi:hypothetical protein